MLPAQIVLATRNASKQRELQRILAARQLACEILTLTDFPDYQDDVIEDAVDFEGNALLKAQAVFAATGVAAIADDSGLCVAALNGMPGIFSARWSGTRDDQQNVTLLLAQLHDVPDDRRAASFVAAVAFVSTHTTVITRGEMSGRIIRQPRGAAGFGYDPIFICDGLEQTNAELPSEHKDALSHRRRALDALLQAFTN